MRDFDSQGHGLNWVLVDQMGEEFECKENVIDVIKTSLDWIMTPLFSSSVLFVCSMSLRSTPRQQSSIKIVR